MSVGSSSRVAYIRNTSLGAYIDTGVTPDDSTKIIVWARNWNPNGGFLFGSRTSLGVDSLGLGTHSGANTGRIQVDYANTTNTYYNNAFQYLSHYHKYELYNGVFKVDDITLATATQGTFSNSYNIHLFGNNNGGSHIVTVLPIDICAAQIYKSGVLVRDFSAVNTPSVGLYDAVTNTLFTNAGSGSFTYGVFDVNAYICLYYVSCNQQQYFDTGLYGTGTTKCISKFKPTGTTKTFYRLFGTRNQGDTIMTEFMVGNTSTANGYYYSRYGNSPNTVYSATSQTNKELVYVQNGNSFSLYKNNAQLGTKTATSQTFTTPLTMYVCASNYHNDPDLRYAFYGDVFFIGFGSEKNFVPAKVNGVAGMYDTYNDVFHRSESGTDFIAGPII